MVFSFSFRRTVLDSSGSKNAGFLWGQNYWLGSQDGCEAVQEPVYITLSDQYERAMKKGLINDLAPYEMDYRVVYIRHDSPWQVEIKFMTEVSSPHSDIMIQNLHNPSRELSM